MLRSRLLQWWLIASLVMLPISALANEEEQENTTTTTTTTIPGEVEEIETFDGPEETTTTTIPEETETTTTTTTTTTIPEWEQSTDIELPEDELDSQGNEVENNIQIDSNHSNGNWSCCGMTDFHMNLHYFQHGNDSNDYTFTLPETTTVDEEELDIDIYEVGFRIGALNNDGTVTYTHTDETTQVNVLEGQDNTDIQNMFEDVVYNIYDTLETFIESFTITINDWSLLDDISFKYIQPTTTTTTLPPPPEPEPMPEPEPEPIVIIPPEEVKDIPIELDNGEIVQYSQREIDDGTLERDQQRQNNLEIYGVELTDEQLQRDYSQDELQNMESEIGEEFFDDVDIPEFVEDEPTEEELERETKKLELEEEVEIFIFEDEEELEEFIDTIIEVEEYLEEFEEVEIIIIEDIEDLEIEFDLENLPKPPKEKEIIEEDYDEFDTEFEEVEEVEVLPEVLPLEDTPEKIEEILTEEMVEEQVEELEEVIEEIIDIPDIEEEDLSDEEIEEAIETFVQELDTEEVVEVLEEVNDIGVQNLEQATEEIQEVVQAVVEEAIEEIEELTEEQVEVVAEVLQVQTEDVEIIAEAVKEDEVVAEAVEEYVERAVENADVENYTLADVVTEVQFETFLENPIETFVDIDFEDITLSSVGDDMTTDQKEKAQEVVVPVILTRIASMAAFMFRKTL